MLLDIDFTDRTADIVLVTDYTDRTTYSSDIGYTYMTTDIVIDIYFTDRTADIVLDID